MPVARHLPITFEWVYPDEDGDSVAATLDLETGEITLSATAPKDIRDESVRTWIWTGGGAGEGMDVDVYFQALDDGGRWLVRQVDLKAIRKACGHNAKAARKPAP